MNYNSTQVAIRALTEAQNTADSTQKGQALTRATFDLDLKLWVRV